MGNYSIKELEKLSGIRAHTIRIWEKRYGIIRPRRTPTNIRFYSDDDLKKILNISLLNNHGLKISHIARLKNNELAEEVKRIQLTSSSESVAIDQLVAAMVNLEEESFEKVMAGIVLRMGFENAILQVVYPFLEKIGILWQTRHITPAQEHFISTLIRQKMIVAIDSLPLAAKGNAGIVLFLPEDELHELGLLFYHYIARKQGFRTYYLGQMVPHKDLLSVCETHRPRILITSVTSVPSKSLQVYFRRLSRDLRAVTILASGMALAHAEFRKPANLTVFSTAGELKTLLEEFV